MWLSTDDADVRRYRRHSCHFNGQTKALFGRLLGDGSRWGMRSSYLVRKSLQGFADAFLGSRDFAGLIVSPGRCPAEFFMSTAAGLGRYRLEQGATVFVYFVHRPEQNGR